MNLKEKIVVITVLLFLIIGVVMLSKYNINESEYEFKIYFFNAGKADAILLSKDNKYMMIDTGERSLSTEILNYFKSNNIEKLDYLIITHFDKDHVGSASNIIDNIEIGEVIQSNYPKDSEYYNDYINSLNKKSITPTTVSGDYKILFDDIEIVVNGPSDIYDSNESNNSSLIISITHKDNKFLFMGDAQNARIKDFLATNEETYDFLKVPYHGNYLKRLEDVLKDKKIKYAVITSSNKEMEDIDTLDLLSKYDVKYYLTRNGSIKVLSDGNKIVFKQ